MTYLRFKPGVIPTRIDHDRVILHIGSLPIVEFRELTVDEIRFILSLVPLSVYGHMPGQKESRLSKLVRKDIILLITKLKLVEEYTGRKPEYSYYDITKNSATLHTKDLSQSVNRVLALRRSKTIALIGLEKFNSLLVSQLLDYGFRRFVIARNIISTMTIGPIHESSYFGKPNLISYIERFKVNYPDAVFSNSCYKLPDLLVASSNSSFEDISAQVFYQAGVPNLMIRIEPLQSMISPVFQKGQTGCWDCYFQQFPALTRQLLKNNSELNTAEIYDFESAELVYLTAALTSTSIVNFFSRHWSFDAQEELTISSNSSILRKKFENNDFKCSFCREDRIDKNSVLPCIQRFSGYPQKVLHK
ncbi:MAG: hypothetical protein LBC43_01470 [Bifidobacteriaceae bacterium]|jgi:hypothetical protein|nr:hypothetical protein [Bifidobacteriaceae bacterium]